MTRKPNHLKSLIRKLEKEASASRAFLKWSETFSKELQPILNGIFICVQEGYALELNDIINIVTQTKEEPSKLFYKYLSEDTRKNEIITKLEEEEEEFDISDIDYIRIKEFMISYQIHIITNRPSEYGVPHIIDKKIDPVEEAFKQWVNSTPEAVQKILNNFLEKVETEGNPYEFKVSNKYNEVNELVMDFIYNYMTYHNDPIKNND